MKIFGFEINRSNGLKSSQGKSTNTGGKLLPEDKDLILKIVQAYKDSSRKDIDKWRQSLLLYQHPEKPRYNYFYDLIDDLKTDGHLKAQIRLYEYAILNTDFSVIDQTTKKPNEEASEFFNQKWFYDFLSAGIQKDLLGTTVLLFKEFHPNKCEFSIIPRRNVVPQQKVMIPDLSKPDTIDYSDPFFENWLIEIEANEGEPLGLLNDIVPNLIWKRNVAQSWAEFCEKFGMPMVTATTNKADPKHLDKIEYMLQQLGEASTGVFPLGTTVDIKEASRTDAYQTYSKFIHFNREEISVAILGGTMITNDGSSRSQSEVHERNLDDKIAMAVKRRLVFLVNDVLMPVLMAQGYSFINENSRFTFKKSHNLKLDKYWKITEGIMKTHEVDESWLSDTFHIPITGKKKIQSPTKINNITALGLNIPFYPEDKCCDTHFSAIASKALDSVQNISNDLAEEIYQKKDTLGTSAKLIAEEALVLINGLITGWGSYRTEASWNATDHLLLQMMEQNIIEFAASKTEARLAAMTDLMLNREKNQIRSLSEFKAEAEKVTKNFNTTYLETERNFTIATAQNSAAYLRFKSEASTVTPYVQYQTVGDDHVREEHQLLNGKVFNLNDNEAMRLYPPNGYNCRCEMEQYVGDKSKVTSGKAAMSVMGDDFANSDFGFNRADTREVFNKSQFYTDDGEILKNANDITYKSYDGLTAFKEFKGLKKLNLDSTITPGNVSELFRSDGKQGKSTFMGFTDHLKRKIILKNKVFKTHTSSKYIKKGEDRHQLFPFVKSVLNAPDEVWLNSISNKKFQYTYIKYFQKEAIVVKTTLGTNNNEIGTWYKLKKKEEDERKGILLKKKKA